MAHFVSAPLVIAKNEDGSDLYLYQGAKLPSHVKGDALKAFVDAGLVAKSEEEAAEQAAENSGASAPAKRTSNS